VTPSIEADLEIMSRLCKYYRELFDVSDNEITYEQACVTASVSLRENPSLMRQIDGRLISVYFQSRADEFNGYAMNIDVHETTAAMIVERLLTQIGETDCTFWTLFEVIIDQNLERAMYSCESIAEVLVRFNRYLSHELNRQAAFIVKLNYLEFEKQQLAKEIDLQRVQCEYYDHVNQRWRPCAWRFQRAVVRKIMIETMIMINNDSFENITYIPIDVCCLFFLFRSFSLMFINWQRLLRMIVHFVDVRQINKTRC
jgi:hypothetical protein